MFFHAAMPDLFGQEIYMIRVFLRFGLVRPSENFEETDICPPVKNVFPLYPWMITMPILHHVIEKQKNSK
jgi:hypothetical protein